MTASYFWSSGSVRGPRSYTVRGKGRVAVRRAVAGRGGRSLTNGLHARELSRPRRDARGPAVGVPDELDGCSPTGPGAGVERPDRASDAGLVDDCLPLPRRQSGEFPDASGQVAALTRIARQRVERFWRRAGAATDIGDAERLDQGTVQKSPANGLWLWLGESQVTWHWKSAYPFLVWEPRPRHFADVTVTPVFRSVLVGGSRISATPPNFLCLMAACTASASTRGSRRRSHEGEQRQRYDRDKERPPHESIIPRRTRMHKEPNG